MNTKILAPVLVIGVALMMGVAGGVALFTDTETSEGNTIEAGDLDLKVGFATVTNQPYDTTGSNLWDDHPNFNGPDDDYKPVDDIDGKQLVNISDIKPGGSGEFYGMFGWSLLVKGNPAWVKLDINDIMDCEGIITEPENDAESGNPASDGGEMLESLEWDVYVTKGNLYANEDEWTYSENYNFGDPIPIVNQDKSQADWEPCEATVVYFVTLQFEVPTDVGNEMQGDNLSFAMNFNATQARHQDTYPW